MEAVAIVTILILFQYTYFGYRVGAVRQATGTKAPMSSGPPEFECMNRVHLNTMEQLVMFLPVLMRSALPFSEKNSNFLLAS